MAVIANPLTGRALLCNVHEGDAIEFTAKSNGKVERVQGVIGHISAFAYAENAPRKVSRAYDVKVIN